MAKVGTTFGYRDGRRLAHPAISNHEIDLSFRTAKTAINVRNYDYELALSYNVCSIQSLLFSLQRYESRKAQW
jgi:hypothetical protein